MTHDDEDEPTNPGLGGPIVSVPPLATSAARADDDRPTIPAPQPARLDPAPRQIAKPPPLPQIDRALEAFDASPDFDLDDRVTNPQIVHEAETVRPPPPPGAKEREEAMAAVMAVASTKPSSIAPREVVRKEPPPSKGSGAMIALGMLALLGAGVIYRQSAMNSRSAGASTAPQPAQEHVAIAPRAPQSLAPQPAPAVEPVRAPEPAHAAPEPKSIEAPPPGEPTVPAVAEQAHAPRAPRKAKASPVVPDELPEQPSRKTIGDAIAALRADFATCAGGRPGVAELDLTLNGNGTVSHALVGGDFAGSPQGSCIARTVRRAHLAPFQQPKFRVLYRLAL